MKTTDQYQQLLEANKNKLQALQNEEYQVVIKVPSQPNILRVTYSKYKGGKITQIEELDALDNVISSGIFKGKIHKGNLPQDVIELKSLLAQLKPSDYMYNEDIYIDEYYKNH